MSQENEDPGVRPDAISGVGPLARQLNQAHTRLWYERVDQDLTGPQFTVLTLLHAHGDMDQGTLGSLAHLDKSTTAPLLDRLRYAGWWSWPRTRRTGAASWCASPGAAGSWLSGSRPRSWR